MTIRIPNAGDAPDHGKGPAGDLLVRVNVAASKVFRRQGSNIYHDARIPLHTALLGGRVRVPTLDGDVDVRVPGGTQQGQEMVLKTRGIQPVFGGERGDLFVTFTVQIPRQVLSECGLIVVLIMLTHLSDHLRIANEKFFRSTLMTWKAEVRRSLGTVALRRLIRHPRQIPILMRRSIMITVRHISLLQPHTSRATIGCPACGEKSESLCGLDCYPYSSSSFTNRPLAGPEENAAADDAESGTREKRRATG